MSLYVIVQAADVPEVDTTVRRLQSIMAQYALVGLLRSETIRSDAQKKRTLKDVLNTIATENLDLPASLSAQATDILNGKSSGAPPVCLADRPSEPSASSALATGSDAKADEAEVPLAGLSLEIVADRRPSEPSASSALATGSDAKADEAEVPLAGLSLEIVESEEEANCKVLQPAPAPAEPAAKAPRGKKLASAAEAQGTAAKRRKV